MAIVLNTWSTLFNIFTRLRVHTIHSFLAPNKRKDRVVIPPNLDEYVSWGFFYGASQGILGTME